MPENSSIAVINRAAPKILHRYELFCSQLLKWLSQANDTRVELGSE
jgi:hypothetical protein